MGLLNTGKKYIEKRVWMTSQSRTQFHERHFKIKGRGKKSFTQRDQLTVQHSTAAQRRTLFKIKGKVLRGSRIVFGDQASEKIR